MFKGGKKTYGRYHLRLSLLYLNLFCMGWFSLSLGYQTHLLSRAVASCMEKRDGFESKPAASGICRSLCDVFVFTEGAQEITFHFLDAAGFHFSSKHSRAGSDHPEIAGAESLKVHEGPELREPGLCGHTL